MSGCLEIPVPNLQWIPTVVSLGCAALLGVPWSADSICNVIIDSPCPSDLPPEAAAQCAQNVAEAKQECAKSFSLWQATAAALCGITQPPPPPPPSDHWHLDPPVPVAVPDPARSVAVTACASCAGDIAFIEEEQYGMHDNA